MQAQYTAKYKKLTLLKKNIASKKVISNLSKSTDLDKLDWIDTFLVSLHNSNKLKLDYSNLFILSLQYSNQWISDIFFLNLT